MADKLSVLNEVVIDDVVMTKDHYNKLTRAADQLSLAAWDLLQKYSEKAYADLEAAATHYDEVRRVK